MILRSELARKQKPATRVNDTLYMGTSSTDFIPGGEVVGIGNGIDTIKVALSIPVIGSEQREAHRIALEARVAAGAIIGFAVVGLAFWFVVISRRMNK